jgi:hypothetical protein
MKSIQNKWRGFLAVLAIACGLVGGFPAEALATGPGHNICGKTTQQLFQACQLEVRDDERVEAALCLNMSDRAAMEACIGTLRETRMEGFAECGEVREARDEICEDVGRGPYDPMIDPANFVAVVTNPYAPFRQGAWWEYEKQTDEGLERIRVEVLPETREILGVTVTTVRDTVTLDGVLIEDTLDWVAQDINGDVWYFGEIVKNFEGGQLANFDGSFEAGKNGAKPGILIRANPEVGEVYRIEYALKDEAEDVAEVLSLNATDTQVPFSDRGIGPVLKTLDTTPLEPDVEEFKYYVPGVGFALEVDPETGERLELVNFQL